MQTESNSQAIATVEEVQRARLRVRDDKLQALDLPILRVFCASPNNSLTATALAGAVGLSSWNKSNLRFGMLAQRIGKALGYRPTTRKDGTTRWWESAALGSAADDSDAANFQWTLRPELVEALRRMRWI